MLNKSTNLPSGFGRVLCKEYFIDGQFLNFESHGF